MENIHFGKLKRIKVKIDQEVHKTAKYVPQKLICKTKNKALWE